MFSFRCKIGAGRFKRSHFRRGKNILHYRNNFARANCVAHCHGSSSPAGTPGNRDYDFAFELRTSAHNSIRGDATNDLGGLDYLRADAEENLRFLRDHDFAGLVRRHCNGTLWLLTHLDNGNEIVSRQDASRKQRERHESFGS